MHVMSKLTSKVTDLKSIPTINKCAFFTDVEGNLDYFDLYVQMSKIIRYEVAGVLDFHENVKDTGFVYGGDSQDKGIGDIRFVKMLLAFKKRYPERVKFIIGNRDGNKIRLCSELNIDLNDENILNDREWQYWVERSKRVTPQDFLTKNGLENTWPNRLKWLLKETMGAEGAFERRKMELAIIRGQQTENITDDEVVQSYRDECDPRKSKDNFMLQYLQKAKVAHIFGSTIFVHGGINPKNIGRVPGKANADTSARVWVKELNQWARNELQNFTNEPRNPEMGKGLTNYGSSENGNHGATVTYSNYLQNGNAQHIPKAVQTFMLRNKISGVVSGHQPHGDCPVVICTGCSNVITADTSYSEMKSESGYGYQDNRGKKCVNEVIVNRDGTYEVHGVLQDGREIEYKVGGVNGDPFVGRQLKNDERWIKAKYKGEDRYLAVKGEGFSLTKFDMTGEELRNYTDKQFVQPDIPFREILKLYRINRPNLQEMGPRTEKTELQPTSGDIVEEYWCDILIRKQSFLPDKPDGITTNIVQKTPIPIPDEILKGRWKFMKTNEFFMWIQIGEWGIYHENWLNEILSGLFARLRQLVE
jgi:hypothetical protein